MKNLWNNKEAQACGHDPLQLRVYTSRLLGKDPSLVLHGGGNTSVKTTITDFFGDTQEVLYVKGSGWDLASITEQGFAAVKLDALKRMATLKNLSDTDMVRQQRAAMLNPNAPTPSVEAILHAVIPYQFVDHSHSDAIVTITNTPTGHKLIKSIYGKNMLIVPYIMPGFILARRIYQMTRNLDWKKCDGIILLNHGLFTFGDHAKTSYDRHIKIVTQAENFIKKHRVNIALSQPKDVNLETLAAIRQSVAKAWGKPIIAFLKQEPKSTGFADLSNVASLANRGTLTPDHVIRTKPKPAILGVNPLKDILNYTQNYHSYFNRNTNGKLKSLDNAPRWAVWKKHGLIAFGRSYKDAIITSDIIDHTIKAIQISEKLGGWKTLSEKNIFEMEYWELEQAKLAKSEKSSTLQGKVALVSGAASGIGQACVESLLAQGVHVAALDINPKILTQFKSQNILSLVCDMTKNTDIQSAVKTVIRHFGGLDIVVSNAGIFPPSLKIADMNTKTWDQSLAINLTSHQRLLTASTKYLKFGIDPTFIIVGTKNVQAPGPGAAAYSVAKAGLTQMARVAALELGAHGIRVNVVHPNQIFDTAIWTPDVLKKRAKAYKMSVAQYKTNNILKTEITSSHVAELICTMAGPTFAKTTGAQIPIDGGNDRVI
ncbi:MAG: bifunctional aldolase/short-chain dehydrogenase [Candidatus Omnitrophica bacterium]|nr:bifunctional aldolase/short-chain dehydrogenase [Candidatus Omnitrophota bacterium]